MSDRSHGVDHMAVWPMQFAQCEKYWLWRRQCPRQWDIRRYSSFALCCCYSFFPLFFSWHCIFFLFFSFSVRGCGKHADIFMSEKLEQKKYIYIYRKTDTVYAKISLVNCQNFEKKKRRKMWYRLERPLPECSCCYWFNHPWQEVPWFCVARFSLMDWAIATMRPPAPPPAYPIRVRVSVFCAS